MKFLAGILAALAFTDVSANRSDSHMNSNGQFLRRIKEKQWAEREQKYGGVRKLESVRNQPATCVDGSVTISGESFSCDNIDFESFLSLSDSVISNGGSTAAGSDIWGWLSPEGKEIALWGVDNGVWFVDFTDPANLQQLGYLATKRGKTTWTDIKVYKDVAYIVKDSGSSSAGIEVFDLNRLVGLTPDKTRKLEPDFIYTEHGNSHNIFINTDTGFAYSVGTNTCSGGLHMVDLSNPLEPTFAGCVSSDGYTHDVQCVVYDGPDVDYVGSEICFAFNEDTLTIWDVSDKANVALLSKLGYGTSEYTHQGWLSPDMTRVVMNDELDEYYSVVETTSTYIANVISLTNPYIESIFLHEESSPDHNLYFWGPMHAKGWTGSAPMENPPSDRYAYLSNYVAGIKVLDVTNPFEIVQVGMFDVAPDISGRVFDGTWSNYLGTNGVLMVSSIDRGLFALRPNMVFDDNIPPTAPTTGAPVPAPTVHPTYLIPDEWVCDESWYGDHGDTWCDCGCGAPDPFCEIYPLASVFGCDNDDDICVEGVCTAPGTSTDSPTDVVDVTFSPTTSPTSEGTTTPAPTPATTTTPQPTPGTTTTPQPTPGTTTTSEPTPGTTTIPLPGGEDLPVVLLAGAIVILLIAIVVISCVLKKKSATVAEAEKTVDAGKLIIGEEDKQSV